MPTFIILILLTNAVSIVTSKCTNTFQKPEVTVEDSEHLLVNWTKSFDGCDSNKVKSAKVHFGSEIKEEVDFEKGTASVKANPCLKHIQISVRLEDNEGTTVWSPTSHYNDVNAILRIENLYSGLLQTEIVDKTCEKFRFKDCSILDIPHELETCVQSCDQTYDREAHSIHFRFAIVDPQSEYTNKVVEKKNTNKVVVEHDVKLDEHCTSKKEQGKEGDENSGRLGGENEKAKNGNNEKNLTAIIIGTSVLVVTIVIMVVVCVVCSRKKKQKKESKAQADVNPVYDGAADYEYEYDDMGNYDSRRKKEELKAEVKAEVVDRSSIYGEKEEGWENAVAIDENPNYEG